MFTTPQMELLVCVLLYLVCFLQYLVCFNFFNASMHPSRVVHAIVLMIVELSLLLFPSQSTGRGRDGSAKPSRVDGPSPRAGVRYSDGGGQH